MKNVFKVIIVFFVCVSVTHAQPDSEALYLHVECLRASDCIELEEDDGSKLSLKKEPVMTWGKDEIVDAYFSEGEYGGQNLNFTFSDEAMEQFAKVTKKASESASRIAIVLGDKIISAPTVKQEIRSKTARIEFGMGTGRKPPTFKQVPWLYKMVTKNKVSTEGSNIQKLVLYIGVILALLLGAGVYLFSKRKESES